jgi:hypothetical protein
MLSEVASVIGTMVNTSHVVINPVGPPTHAHTHTRARVHTRSRRDRITAPAQSAITLCGPAVSECGRPTDDTSCVLLDGRSPSTERGPFAVENSGS